MCVAVPLRVTDIDGKEAKAEAFGASRTIRVDLLSDVRVGDYVAVHAGIAIAIINEKDAQDNLDIIKDAIEAEMDGPFLC